MYSVNKEARAFLKQNLIAINNGFVNEGLIDYDFYCDFEDYEQLENLYNEALKRNYCNRTITLGIYIFN